MFKSINIEALLVVILLLVAVVNIIVEVLKKVTWNKIPTSLLALIVSLAVTTVAFVAYCQVLSIVIYWYYFVAAIAVGFMVAYAAMFGFDKLKEILQVFDKIGKSGGST
jgi:hypothetical protein